MQIIERYHFSNSAVPVDLSTLKSSLKCTTRSSMVASVIHYFFMRLEILTIELKRII